MRLAIHESFFVIEILQKRLKLLEAVQFCILLHEPFISFFAYVY